MVRTTRRRKDNEREGIHIDNSSENIGVQGNIGGNSPWAGAVQLNIGDKAYEGDDRKKGKGTETVTKEKFDGLEELIMKTQETNESARQRTNERVGNLESTTKNLRLRQVIHGNEIDDRVTTGEFEEAKGNYNDALSQFGQMYNSKMGEIDGKFGALEKDSGEYRKEFSGVKSELIAQLEKIKELEGLTEEHKKEIDTLEKDIRGKSTVEELKNLESMVNREINYTRKESKSYIDAKMQSLEPVFKNLGDSISNLNTRVKDLDEDTKSNLEIYLGRLEFVEGLSQSDAVEIEKINEVLKRKYITRDELIDAESRMRYLSEQAVEKSEGYTDFVKQELIEEIDGYKTRIEELGGNVAGIDDKLTEIKDGLIGMINGVSETTGAEYKGLRAEVDHLTGETLSAVLDKMECIVQSPTIVGDRIREFVIGDQVTGKYKEKLGELKVGKNYTVGDLVALTETDGNLPPEKEAEIKQIAYAGAAKRCKLDGIDSEMLSRSRKYDAGSSTHPPRGITENVGNFLELDENAKTYRKKLDGFQKKNKLSGKDKETVRYVASALSRVGMDVKEGYVNDTPTKEYVRELSGTLKKFKELMK